MPFISILLIFAVVIWYEIFLRGFENMYLATFIYIKYLFINGSNFCTRNLCSFTTQ